MTSRSIQREIAENLNDEMIDQLTRVIMRKFRERRQLDSFHKWDGAVYIAAADVVIGINRGLIGYGPFVDSVEKHLKWDVTNGKKGEELLNLLRQDRYTIRGVSQLYESEFHNERQIPGEAQYLNLFNGMGGGNGHGVLIMPESHPFSVFCLKQCGINSSNFTSGAAKKLADQRDRGVISQEEYETQIRQMTPQVVPMRRRIEDDPDEEDVA